MADTDVGAPGTVEGVTADEAVEADELPFVFVATTVNVYAVPFVKPVTVAVVVLPFAVVAVKPPGLLVTV